jgi:hypothetical protein
MGQNYAKKIEKKRCHSEKCFNFANQRAATFQTGVTEKP